MIAVGVAPGITSWSAGRSDLQQLLDVLEADWSLSSLYVPELGLGASSWLDQGDASADATEAAAGAEATIGGRLALTGAQEWTTSGSGVTGGTEWTVIMVLSPSTLANQSLLSVTGEWSLVTTATGYWRYYSGAANVTTTVAASATPQVLTFVGADGGNASLRVNGVEEYTGGDFVANEWDATTYLSIAYDGAYGIIGFWKEALNSARLTVIEAALMDYYSIT